MDYRGGFCEKLLEASHVSDRANASQLQDRHAAGQGQANQHLCDNVFRKKKNQLEGAFAAGEKSEKMQETLQTPRSVQKEGEEVLQAPEQRSPCSLW
ncbi:hypothetical protein GRJ2_001709700 [Grus japonensis]|uniref:Uncharacterized protein n=1 Tax=Grus japonensis TaxID=30415 RepID=A0ABC9X613_GRUJA